MNEEIIDNKMKEIFRSSYIASKHDTLEDTFNLLSRAGYGRLQTAFLLYQELGVTFSKANVLVQKSKAWDTGSATN